jgi:hypothetical protein
MYSLTNQRLLAQHTYDQLEALSDLADHLEKLPDNLWNFIRIIEDVTDCGTIGCAMGHAPEVTSCQKLGFGYRDTFWPETGITRSLVVHNCHADMHNMPEALGMGFCDFVHIFMDEQATKRGLTCGFVSKEMVVADIRAYLRGEDVCDRTKYGGLVED